MPASRPSAVTIGAYDGVHCGHRQVVARVRSLARDEHLRSVVVTFDRHPASVVRPESAPKLLTDLDQKLELLRSTGVDDVLVVRFDQERSTEPAEDFVEEVLVGTLSCRVVVVGRDFHFGKGRGGSVALLEEMGATLGFRVIPFDLVADRHDEIVSSTRIRTLIATGDLGRATELLERPHEVRGLLGAEPRVGDGADDVALFVPDEILLPPPGNYRVATGPVGAVDELIEGLATVAVGRGAVVVHRPAAALGPGRRLRVLFLGAA